MYDCGGPTLVFVTQTHHPVLEHFTGYIFAYYEFHYHKPRELFFTHIHEAQVFALYKEARLEMDAAMAPARMSALEYVLTAEDDSRFLASESAWALGPGMRPSARKARRQSEPLEADLAKIEEDMQAEEPVQPIEWFGEEDT